MLSHENIVANVLMMGVGEGGNMSQADVVVAFLPFFHI
jgi:long-subunit acyl-CoA synthetase (AMP-forming)